jgi:demethylmenaquinone methyltransferase/2-methoxy-6-polyprenyl-1,4-benzoquinol methylase
MTFNSAQEKHQYVMQMFAKIAPRYDLMNRLMTGGQDIRWRKLLIKQMQLPPNGNFLDIATGTGDIAFESLRQYPTLKHVVGADFTLPMMTIGQTRFPNLPGRTRLSWSGADTLHLPFPDNCFEGVASGFLMRNVTDVPAALAEQTRVCRPGGRIAILDIPKPADNLFGKLFRLYFHNIVPVLGGIISGHLDAYTYLPNSADAFLSPDELKAEMEKVGLYDVHYTRLMFNTVALHVGAK